MNTTETNENYVLTDAQLARVDAGESAQEWCDRVGREIRMFFMLLFG